MVELEMVLVYLEWLQDWCVLIYVFMKLSCGFDECFEVLCFVGCFVKWYSVIGNEVMIVLVGLVLCEGDVLCLLYCDFGVIFIYYFDFVCIFFGEGFMF